MIRQPGSSEGMRRALFIAFHYPPANAIGTQRTLKFTRDLLDLGWQASVITVPPALHASIDDRLLEQIPPAVRVHRVRCLDSSRVFSVRGRYPAFAAVPDRFVSWLPFAVARGLRLLREGGHEALYSTSPVPTAHLIALVLHRRTSLPWVADFRDPWGSGQERGWLRSRFETRLEHAVVEGADRILGTTPEFVDELGRRFGDAVRRKALAIPNGYDENDFPATPPADDDIFTLLHAGFLYRDFRHPRALLHAVRLCLDRAWLREPLRLELLGCGPLGEDRAFRELLVSLGLESCVVTAPRVPHSQALERIARASVLVVIQGGETRTQVPGKVYEYLRTARPILCLAEEGSATARVVREFGGVAVVPPDATEAIAATLAKWHADWRRGPIRFDRMREGLERYSRRTAAARLAAELDSLVVPTSVAVGTPAGPPPETTPDVGAFGGSR